MVNFAVWLKMELKKDNGILFNAKLTSLVAKLLSDLPNMIIYLLQVYK